MAALLLAQTPEETTSVTSGSLRELDTCMQLSSDDIKVDTAAVSTVSSSLSLVPSPRDVDRLVTHPRTLAGGHVDGRRMSTES